MCFRIDSNRDLHLSVGEVQHLSKDEPCQLIPSRWYPETTNCHKVTIATVSTEETIGPERIIAKIILITITTIISHEVSQYCANDDC